MGLTESQQELVEKAITSFNFHKVRRVMEFLEWTWGNDEYPTIVELEFTARRLLEAAFRYANGNDQDYGYCSSGGFEAHVFENAASLSFNAEQIDVDIY